MNDALRRLRDGRVAIVAAAAWAVFDALVHVAADEVEPLRISGNLATVGAAVFALVADRFGGRPRLAAVVCGISAVLVLAFNGAWVANEGELPVPAAIFITVAVVVTAWAGYGFLVEADARPDQQPTEALR